MDKAFADGRIFTVPNLMSLGRLLMIPYIVRLYQTGAQGAAALMVLLSGLTDVADGIVARVFDQVSALGKILDPVADKLTLAALLWCLISRYEQIVWLLGILLLKEVVMVVSGLVVIRKTAMINSAQWFGKLSTFLLYAVIVTFFLFPDLPAAVVNGMAAMAGLWIVLSCVRYLDFYRKLLKKGQNQ